MDTAPGRSACRLRRSTRAAFDRGLLNDRHLLRGARGLVAVLRVVAGVLLAASVASEFRQRRRPLFLQCLDLLGGRDHALPHGRLRVPGQRRRRLVRPADPDGRDRRHDAASGAQKRSSCSPSWCLIVGRAVIVVFAWPVIRDLWDFDQRSQSADVPMVIPQAMVPIGLSIMALLVVDPSPDRRRPRLLRRPRALMARRDEPQDEHRC